MELKAGGGEGATTSPESKSISQMSPGSFFNCFCLMKSLVMPMMNGVGASSNCTRK